MAKHLLFSIGICISLFIAGIFAISETVFAENLSGGSYTLQGASFSDIAGTLSGSGYVVQADILTISGALTGGDYSFSTGFSAPGTIITPPTPSGGGGGGGGSFTQKCQINAVALALKGPGQPVRLSFSSPLSNRVFIFQGKEYTSADSVIVYPTVSTTYSAFIKNSMYSCTIPVIVSGDILPAQTPNSKSYCIHHKGYYSIGSKGESIRRIQRFLTAQGYPVRDTGYYSYSTALAVHKFQQQYFDFILGSQGFRNSTGIWANMTDKKAVGLGFCNGETIVKIPEAIPAQISNVSCEPVTGVYRIGSYGDTVKKIQDFLNKQGFVIPVSGKYDYQTALAVANFQTKYFEYIISSQGFHNVTGIWGKMSSQKARDLGLCREQAIVTRTQLIDALPINKAKVCLDQRIDAGTINSTSVKQIQRFLIDQGYTNVRVTGNYVADTIVAVRAFQEKYADDILKPFGFTSPTGVWAKATATKASELGLCDYSSEN